MSVAEFVLLVRADGSQDYRQIVAEIADVLCDENPRQEFSAARDQHAAWQFMARWRS